MTFSIVRGREWPKNNRPTVTYIYTNTTKMSNLFVYPEQGRKGADERI